MFAPDLEMFKQPLSPEDLVAVEQWEAERPELEAEWLPATRGQNLAFGLVVLVGATVWLALALFVVLS